MPKATLTYNLPEENEEFNLACRSTKYHSVIWDILQLFRSKLKYEDLKDEEYDLLSSVSDSVYDIINEAGISEDF